ncbi:MAG: lamin tail domain-containing protein, partial [Methanocellales archaeon]|nr:lamin tail domain-containing protein [Methanocellales archaeon]MDD5235624.1 lamin tail domain-containing protein [Methanocellales archaeon]
DIIFANVTFNAVGTAGSSTPLNLHITTLKNTGYNSIPATVINGSFTLESAGIPWDAYLVPSDSTGDYGEDTPVELWVDYDDTGLTYGALAYQFDLHFDPNCVNVTSADFSTSPFGSHVFNPYAPGVVRVLENNYLTMAPISSGTYKLATLTLHGECLADSTSDLLFDPTWCTVSDTDGNPIENRYTNGTYTCTGPEPEAEPEVVINEFNSYNTSGDWIELYNKGTSEILLDGWSINDSDSEMHSFGASDSIPIDSYLVVEVGSRLNRDGDTITLLNGGEIIDEVTYGSGAYEAPAPGGGNSTGRYPDGVDTDNDAADFIEFGAPTPGEQNVISISEVTISIGTVIGNGNAQICIDNASNIGSVDITITYDPSVCVITEVTDGDFDFTIPNLEQNEVGLVRIGALQMENPGLEGSIVLAHLAFLSTSASGTSALNLTVNELTDATPECNDIPYIVVNGTYLVFLNGDVNGDGEVTLYDAMYLSKHVIGLQGFENIVEVAADVNGDGEITLSDAMYLAKHVLGISGFEELK